MKHAPSILSLTLLVLPLVNGCGSSREQAVSGPKAYVGLFGDNSVAVVDVASSKVVGSIPVSAPDGLVSTPDGAKVYVSSNNAGVVHVIDTKSDQMKAMIPVGAQPSGLSITSDGKYVVASVQGDGRVVIIETATDSVVAMADVGKAHSSGLSPDGALAFVTSQVADLPAVDVVRVPSAAAGPSFALTAAPRAICELEGKLYATMAGSADVQVLDAVSGALAAPIRTGGSPHDIRPSVDGSLVLTVSQTANELELIEPRSSTVIAQVATGALPHWIALSTDGAFAYVTNEGDDSISVVDLAARAVKYTIPVGDAPRKIALVPGS
jgi:YVTN family beta-propeller protein